MPCACARPIPIDRPRVLTRDFRVVELPSLPEKARWWPGTDRVEVSAPWWRKLSGGERAAVLAHERAHAEAPGVDCETCVDKRAGAILHHEGRGRWEVWRAFSKNVQGRDAGRAAMAGWDAVERARARNLEGMGGAVQEITFEELEIVGRRPSAPFPIATVAGIVGVLTVLWLMTKGKV